MSCYALVMHSRLLRLLQLSQSDHTATLDLEQLRFLLWSTVALYPALKLCIEI